MDDAARGQDVTSEPTGRLPAGEAQFIGRRREIAEIQGLLVRSRFVTLIGAGGSGKSRLAQAVARYRSRAFPDGVWYADLTEVTDRSTLLAQLAETFGHPVASIDAGRPARLWEPLRRKHLLLVLDNCDRVAAAAAPLIDDILAHCPAVRILGTSRAPLQVAGNVTYQVPSLYMPSEDSADKDIDASDAVRFFVNRARVAVGDFELTADNRSLIHNLIRGLDGLPLALELAATQLSSRTANQIAAEVDQDGSVLRWSDNTAGRADRHRSLYASLAWSAERCTAAERRLWSRLAIFPGTFDVDAADDICAAHVPSDDLLDSLQGLVERSILEREDHGFTARYWMTRTARTFGIDILTHGPELTTLQARHSRCYLDLVARADSEWNTTEQIRWLRVLPLEYENITAALTFAIADPNSVEASAAAISQLWRYLWWPRGWHAEGLLWVQQCLDLLDTPVARARLLLLGSLLAWTVGEPATAVDMLDEGVRLGHSTEDQLTEAFAHHVRGDAALYEGDLTTAVLQFSRALASYPEGQEVDPRRVDTLLMITLANAATGDIENARSAHLRTLDLIGPDEKFQRSYSMLYLSEAMRSRGMLGQSLALARDALRLKRDQDDPFGMAWAFDVLAEIACDMKQLDKAFRFLAVAGSLWKSMSIDTPTLDRLRIRESSTRHRLRTNRREPRHGQRQKVDLSAAIEEALTDRPITAHRSDPGILTKRESEIAELVAEGLTNKQVAATLVIAQRTADAHVQNILTKLGFNSRAQIAAWTRPKSASQQVHS